MSAHYIPFSSYKKMALNCPKFAAMGFLFQGTQERVRNSDDKRSIGAQATEVSLYFDHITLLLFLIL